MTGPIEIIFLVGLGLVATGVIALADRLYLRAFRSLHRGWVLATGFIGVPAHELSHAGMALLFGIRVTSMSLLSPAPQSPLGQVTLRPNPRNLLHRLGLFFIGVSPLLAGSLLVWLLMSVASDSRMPGILPPTQTDWRAWHDSLQSWGGGLFVTLTSWPRGWVTPATVFAAISISVHALPSQADVRGAAKGLSTLFALLLGAWGVGQVLPSHFGMAVVSGVARGMAVLVGGIIQMALLAMMGAAVALVIRAATWPIRASNPARHP